MVEQILAQTIIRDTCLLGEKMSLFIKTLHGRTSSGVGRIPKILTSCCRYVLIVILYGFSFRCRAPT